MASSEELTAQAYTEAQQGVYKAVADNLKAQSGLLQLGGVISTPPEPDWDALAKEAIEQRKLNGIALSSLPKGPDGQSVEDMIPDTQRVNLIAQDVADGVKDNTGMFAGATIGQVFRGAWDVIKNEGLGGLWTVLSGIFNMLLGDGQSEAAQTLKQAIGKHTATDIRDGVTTRLKSHQSELHLSDDQIAQIGVQAQNSVHRQAGIPEVEVPGATASGDLTPGTVAGIIRGQVISNLGLKQEGDKIVVNESNPAAAAEFRNMGLAAGRPDGQFTDDQRKAIVDTLTVSLNGVATANPPIRDAEAIKAQIKSQLTTDDPANGLGPTAMGLGDMKPADREVLLEYMSNTLTVNYMKSRHVDKAAGEEFERQIEGTQNDLKAKLTQISIRPGVIAALGLEEKTEGVYTNAGPAGGGNTPQISTLEQIAGAELTNEQRGVLIDTLTNATTHAATNNITDPTQIRNHIRDELKKNAQQMGFGDLSVDNQNRLFTVIANQTTLSYVENTAGKQAADAYAAVSDPETNRLKGELTVAVVRQRMFEALVPKTLDGVENAVIDKVKSFRDSLSDPTFLQSENIPPAVATRMQRRLDTLLSDTSLEGRAKILSFAANMGKGPNQAQRDAMAKEVSTAIVDVLSDEGNRNKSKEELAPLIETAVQNRLTEKQDEIHLLNPFARFRLDADMIAAAGVSAKDNFLKLDDNAYAEIAEGQRRMGNASVPNTQLKFDVEYAQTYARTMEPISDAAPFNDIVHAEIKAETRKAIDAEAGNWSVSAGYAPNNSQRDRISEVVANAITPIMTNPNIPSYRKHLYVHSAVTEALKAEQDAMNRSFQDGGYANNPMNRFTFAFYKWSMDDSDIRSTADAAVEAVQKKMGTGQGAQQVVEMNRLLGNMPLEAPRVEPPKTPTTTLAQNTPPGSRR